MEAAGGVHQNYVAGGKLCFASSTAHDFERLVRARAGPDGSAGGFSNLRKLLAGSGAIDVGGNNDGTVAVLGEPFPQLARRGGLAGALQPADQPHRRRSRRKLGARLAAKKFCKLIAHDLHYLLIGRELEQDFRTEGLLADLGDEIVRDAEIDVAFKQRLTNFAESHV